MLQLRTLAGLAFAGSLGALAGCLVTNQNHCALNQGACGEGFECSACAVENNGCVAAGSILDEVCVFVSATSNPSTSDPTTQGPDPTVTETSVDTDTTTLTTVDPTSTTETVTSDPTTETTDTTVTTDSTTQTTGCLGEVVDNPECGGIAPYCVDEECVSCKNVDCGELFPDKPACEQNSGVCVQCVDDDDCDDADKPACNTDTATCEGCTSHAQCPETACNFETGECFPPENVFFVQNQTGKCADKDGFGLAEDKPFCTLPEALGRVVEGSPTTIKVANANNVQGLTNALPPGNYTVAIMQIGGSPPSMAHDTTDPFLWVQPGNKVFVQLVNMRNLMMPKANPAVICDGGDVGASLWLDRVRITNSRSAIRAEGCNVHVRRSVITGQLLGGIDVVGLIEQVPTKLWFENSFITDGLHSAFGAIRLSVHASAEVLYSTIALNGGAAQIECQNLNGPTLTVRNSVVVGDDETPILDACMSMPKNSLVTNDTAQTSIDKIFTGFMNGTYPAKIGGGLKDLAQWELGDPEYDFDGNDRPTRPGGDYAGADRPE